MADCTRGWLGSNLFSPYSVEAIVATDLLAASEARAKFRFLLTDGSAWRLPVRAGRMDVTDLCVCIYFDSRPTHGSCNSCSLFGVTAPCVVTDAAPERGSERQDGKDVHSA